MEGGKEGAIEERAAAAERESVVQREPVQGRADMNQFNVEA